MTRHFPAAGAAGASIDAVFEVDASGAVRLTELTFRAREITGTTLRDFPLAAALAEVEAVAATGGPPAWVGRRVEEVGRPDGTDDWYRRFASALLFVKASGTRSPAEWLAAKNEVPVSAVHRWTREARRRGYLPHDPKGSRSS